MTEHELQGELVEPGRARIENPDEPGEWVEAEYKDGWVGRKLVNEDPDVYHSMVHPYYQRCAMCREYDDTQLWGYDSPYCPLCEQWHDFVLPEWFRRVVDEEEREEVEI